MFSIETFPVIEEINKQQQQKMSTVQQSQPLQQSPDTTKKVGSDGEDFSDTANETGTFEVRVQVFLFDVISIVKTHRQIVKSG